MTTIYFDLDGVLADYKGCVEAHGLTYIPSTKRTLEQNEAIHTGIKQIPHFYYQLPPIRETVELFLTLKKNYHCEILSAIPKEKWGFENVIEDKNAWVRKYLGDDVKVNLVKRVDKPLFCKGRDNILIDDKQENIDAWIASGGTGVLFRTPNETALLLSLVLSFG